jgi:serine/threonine-protein kinase
LLLQETAASGGGDEQRRRLYDRLVECRVGFRAALEAWPGNGPARRDMERALQAMIEYELSRGDARAAAPLLAELSEPPEPLRKRVDAAIRGQSEEERRLRRLAASLDPDVGRRTRVLVGAGLGAFWTLAPLAAHFLTNAGRSYSFTDALGLGTAVLVVGVAVAYRARKALFATAINRRLVASFALVMLIEIGNDLWGHAAGRTPAEVLALDAFLYFVMSSSLVIHFTPALAPAALGYGVTFVVASLRPELAWLAIAAGNLLLTLNAVWVWRKPLATKAAP